MNSSAKSWGSTISKEGEASRIWIGNLDVKNTECVDLEQMFKKYGKVIGIDINNNGFAFVQFENVDDAQKAVIGENQKFLKNRKLEVKMFGKKRDKKFDKFDKFDKKKRNRSRSPPGHNNKRFFNQQRGAKPNFRNNKPPFNHQPNFNPNQELNQFNQYNQLMQSQQLQPPQLQALHPSQTSTQLQLDQLQQRPNSNNLSNNPAVANELEIIVANKEQWSYAEMLEKKLRNETCLRFIDLVFPHSEEMILVTLKDLYEKKTLYAVVVNAMNEQNNTFTLHILHSQSEFSNVSINEGIQLICADFIKELSNPQSIYFRGKELNSLAKDQLNSKLIVSSTYNNPNNLNKFNLNNQQFNTQPNLNNNQINNLNNNNQIKQDSIPQQLQPAAQQTQQSSLNKLPNNVAYILRMTLDDNTAQFLSISQIDSVIEYYNNEKAKLLSKSTMNFSNNLDTNKPPQSQTTLAHLQTPQQSLSTNFNQTQQQPQQSQSFSNLLDDPQLKAALNQIMGFKSTLTNTSTDNQLNNESNTINNYVSSSLSNYNNNLDNNNLQSMQPLPTNFNTNNNLNNHNNISNHKQIRQQSNFYNNKESSQFRNNKNNFRSRFN